LHTIHGRVAVIKHRAAFAPVECQKEREGGLSAQRVFFPGGAPQSVSLDPFAGGEFEA
jgi:hypothetical protein